MEKKRVIEVPVPEGVEPTQEDIEILEATFRVLIGLRCGAGRAGDDLVRGLRERGWTVDGYPGWIAEARRNGETERAAGRTRAEALVELESLARMDELVPIG